MTRIVALKITRHSGLSASVSTKRNFTPRDDKIVDFSDQDQTYKATLYKCPE